MTTPSSTRSRPSARRRAGADDRLARVRRRRRRTARRLRRVRSDAVPGDRVRAVVGKSKRAYAEARAVEILRAQSGADPGGRRSSRRALAGAALRAPARGQAGAGGRRAAADRQARGLRARADRPAVEQWRYRNKLEYSFGTEDTGRLVCGFHAPGRWDQIVEVRDCLLASEAGNAARERIVEWCRGQGLTAYDRRSGGGPAAQPGRARRAPHRPAPGPAGHESWRARPRGAGRRRRSRWRDCCGRRSTASPRRRSGGVDRAARRRRPARGGDRRTEPAHLARGVLSDQHRDGRAAVRAGDRVRAAAAASSASTTCTAGSERSGC